MINCFGFCSFNCASGTPLSLPSVDKAAVENGIFNVMDMSSLDGISPRATIPADWDADTIMRAEFNGNVNAGNVDYAFYEASTLRIKRKEVGTNTWISIADIPVAPTGNINFTVFDRLNRSGIDYEYAIIPIVGTVEGPIITKTVHSEFDGVCLYDGDEMYYSVMDVSLNQSRVQVDSVVKTIGSRYPTYVKVNRINYSTGDCTAFFLPENGTDCGFTTDKSHDYRERLVDFLVNGNSKILKDDAGHIWIVEIQGDVVYENDGHPDHVLTKFNWVQIGDAKDETDLREFGFLIAAGE